MRLFKKRPRKLLTKKAGPAVVPHASYWLFEPLEPRVLLSADAIGGSYDGYDDDFVRDSMLQSPEELRTQLEFKLLHKLQDLHNGEAANSRITLSQPESWNLPSVDLDALQSLITPAESPRTELMIVDSATPDAEKLLQDLRSDSDVQYQVHFLNGERGGVAQISEILQQYSQVDAIHVIGHGAAGVLQLGSDTVHNGNLAQHQSEFENWRTALAADADILFYGCDLAADESGRVLLNALADFTGADIAASDDKTGSANLGADWQLEFHIGKVDAVLPFAGAMKANWEHSLATIVVTSDEDTALPLGVNSVTQLLSRENITLRQAIQAVNYDFQFVSSKTVHTIAFDLSGTDYTITLTKALPDVSATVVIDGTTDPNYADAPVVTLTGTGKFVLLKLTGNNIEVRGLELTGSGDDALVLKGRRNIIAGNHFTDNAVSGIFIDGGSHNVIGGDSSLDRNVISGNELYGIYIGVGAQGNQVIGNYIGTSADGQSEHGNASSGIRIAYLSTAANAATTVISGNVISANSGDGIYLGTEASHVDILNNWIGVAADKKSPLGNEGDGIAVKGGGFPAGSTSDILIQGNTIAHNVKVGVSVENSSASDVRIVQNQIYDNGRLGIDLGDDGVTLNDKDDTDNGPNSLINFPVISSVSIVDGKLHISGSLNSRDHNGSFDIHFYYTDTENSSGHGDAKGYIGSIKITPALFANTTNFNAEFSTVVPDNIYITATATSSRGTSEFAENVHLPVGNADPINIAPTGEVTIVGSLVQGALLTAANNLVDANGISAPIRYQWYRNGTAIDEASEATYRLTQDDVGANITVALSYVDDDGFEEEVQSAVYGPVQNINDDPTGSVAIIGEAKQGQKLTIENLLYDLDGLPEEYSYQWFRNGMPIPDATGDSYTLTQDDVGYKITVSVTYIDGQGTEETVASDEIGPVENVNDPPTGAPVINGSAVQGQTLQANPSFSDGDGLNGSFVFQWNRDGVAIEGANGQSYTLTQADVGSRISVTVFYTDAHGTDESITSDPTDIVENINDAPTGNLLIEGVVREGRTLSVENTLNDLDGNPASFNYQWLRDGVAIAGATDDTYTLTQDDVGSTITVVATYVDGGNTTETVTSDPVGPVLPLDQAPTGGLAITGSPTQGQILSVQNTINDPDGNPSSFTYQWYRGGVPIAGETGASYQLTQADVGSIITVSTTYVDGYDNQKIVFSTAAGPVANINDAPTGNLFIEGEAKQHQILTIKNTLIDPDGNPADFSYQWFRNGVAITGATGDSYTLTQADVGQSITVKATYVDGGGYTEMVTSVATAPVANVNDAPTGSVLISGELEVGGLLTTAADIEDMDGLPATLNYQWYRNGVAIDGATAATYQITAEDLGTRLYVQVSYVDEQGTPERMASDPTAEIGHINAPPVGEVLLDGLAREDQILTANPNFTDADGISGEFFYSWYRDGVLIQGANGATYQLTDADVGTRISVQVSYVDDFGKRETLTSAMTAPVTAVNDAPTGTVTISGVAIQGDVLTASHTVDDIDGMPAAVHWQWYRDGVAIANATGSSYQLTAADVDAVITVTLSYVDGQGFNETVSSEPTAPVAAINLPAQGQVLLSGSTTVGGLLMVSANITDGNGLAGLFVYIWQRDGEVIPGASGDRYQITEADIGTTISVLVTFTDARGFEEMVMSNELAIPVPGPVQEPEPELEPEPEPRPEPQRPEPPRPVDVVPPAREAPSAPPAAPEASAPSEAEQPESGEGSPVDEPSDGDVTITAPDRKVDASKPLFGRADLSADMIGFAMVGSETEQELRQRLDSFTNSLASGVDKLLTSGGPLQSVLSGLQESLTLLSQSSYSDDLADAVQAIKENRPLTTAIVGGTAAVSTGLSVGYVIWTLRSGILMTGLLSSLPAWRFIDPLPILSGRVEVEEEEDEESLESLVADNPPPQARSGAQ